MEVKQHGRSITLYGIKSVTEVEPYWAGFKALWKEIQIACETKQRKPRIVSLTEEPSRVCANDYDSARRLLVDLSSNTIIGNAYISTGECSLANLRRDGTDLAGAVNDVPKNVAMLTCTWSEFYRTFSIEAQFPPGSLVKFLK